MKPKIFAYYQPIQLRNQKEEFARAHLWKESWTKQGWQPVMLNKSHAQCSKLYQKLMAKLLKASRGMDFADQNRFQIVFARFSRWCALQAAGGGWLSDYDAINIGFTPEDAAELQKKHSLILIGEPKPYLFHAGPEICSGCISKFIVDDLLNEKSLKREAEILNAPEIKFDMNKKIAHITVSGGKSKAEALKKLLK